VAQLLTALAETEATTPQPHPSPRFRP
jgi:hypothetical protein